VKLPEGEDENEWLAVNSRHGYVYQFPGTDDEASGGLL
jgi:hypothetical protein